MHRRIYRTMTPGAAAPLVIAVTVMLSGFLAGCGDREAGVSPTSDETELSSLVTSDQDYADYFDLDTGFGEPPSGPALAPGQPTILSPIETLLGWHRERESVTHTITTRIADGTAHVTAEAAITGTLHLHAVVDGVAGRYVKPLAASAHRSATFQRLPARRENGRRWDLVSISGTRIESATDGNPPSVGIGSVTLQVAGHDAIVITDPAIEVPADEIPRFAPGAEVTITVASSGAAARAFLHTGGRHGAVRTREPIPAREDGVFEGTWHAPERPGVYHASIDLLSEPALFETDAADGPYDSVSWALPIHVRVE